MVHATSPTMGEISTGHIDVEIDKADLPIGLYASENYLQTSPDLRRRSELNVTTDTLINYGSMEQENLAIEGGERVQRYENVTVKENKHPKGPEGYQNFGMLAASSFDKGTLEESVMQEHASEVPLDKKRNYQQMTERTSNFVPEDSEKPRNLTTDEPLLPTRRSVQHL
ncbi:uncharacterized protein LOC129586882 isoform X2 [Paramacrobiotus metropolitanus]|uniref:uncharacterized protein LOC129586882 isoform X2 n=1 Tax=Paramacrobiotus metropolitanus TaxID=2943436 RepID=UPI002445C61A|nr:uncharacterized protein LOC129586882 isoform X2 [Paramacrobiotus metropolitanus]